MLRAILFDLYDTLAYLEIESYRRTKEQMAAAAGISADVFIGQWQRYTSPAAEGQVLTTEERVARVLKDLGIDLQLPLICRLARMEADLQEQSVHLFAGAREVLTYIGGTDLKLGLVTNTSLATSRVLDILSIESLFDVRVFSYSIGVRKPEPAIYMAACEKLVVSPSDCLFVGDGNDRELDGAHRVGMRTVKVGTRRDSLIRSEQSTSFDYCIDNLRELIPIIENLLDRTP